MLNLRDILKEEKNIVARQKAIRIACIGDSITGWNNFDPEKNWPFPVYPQYLEKSLEQEVANFGLAGAKSRNALMLSRAATQSLPNSRIYILGYGTNDLGESEDCVTTTKDILINLEMAVDYLKQKGKILAILGIPQAKLSMFPDYLKKVLVLKRQYCNKKLEWFCSERKVPFIDIYGEMTESNLGDYLHPNESGAQFISQQIIKSLEKAKVQLI